MRKANINSGFILCFLANLLLNCEWGLIALLLWSISYWFGFSWYPAAAVAVLWVLVSLGITSVLAWSSGADSYPTNQDLPNVNPYSPGKTIYDDEVVQEFLQISKQEQEELNQSLHNTPDKVPFKRKNKYYNE